MTKTQLDRIEEKLDKLLSIFDEGVIDDVESVISVTSDLSKTSSSSTNKIKKINNHLLVDGEILDKGKTTGLTLTIHATTDDEMRNVEKIIKKHYDQDLSRVSMFYVKDKNLLNDDWTDCPEYKICPELLVSPSFKFHYNNINKFNDFVKELNGSKIKQASIWCPERITALQSLKTKKYVGGKNTSTTYPIYVISKGRWEKKLTIDWLIKCKIAFKVIVEPDELDKYSKHIDVKNILVLPEESANQGQGSIPARNYAMVHSTQGLHKRCWILDDNINGYMWSNLSQRIPVESHNVFTFIEEYTDKFTNVLIAGHEYSSCCTYDMKEPVQKNHRVFSSMLVSNNIPELLGEGWRGKYNEDVDICIRTLKAGYTTLLFNNITSNKNATGIDKGGNTDGIYKEDNNGSGVLKTQSLIDQHPDCVTSKIDYITKKNPKGRTTHDVKWRWNNNELKYCHNHAEVSKSYDMSIVER